MSSNARLFVAVDPPAMVRVELACWARRAVSRLSAIPGSGAARLLEASALHLTLCFLGAQPADRIDEIAAVVAGHVPPAGSLALGAPVWLPRRRPRVLAVAVHDPGGGLADLAGDLGRALGAAIGWEPESRRFRPHITVARMRSGSIVPGMLDPTPPLAFEPESLTLYRSRLDPDGAVYQPLARVALSRPADDEAPRAVR